MPVEEKSPERYLEVGNAVMLHTDPNRKDCPRFKTVIRGWRRAVHILLDRPKSQTGNFAALQEGQNVVIRYLQEGQACAFDTQVLDWDTRRVNPYLRIRWPQQVQYISFRKFERIKVQFPCAINWPDGHEIGATMLDISIGGCGIASPQPCKTGAIVRISFTLPDGTKVNEVETLVRNVREVSGNYVLGCEFSPDQAHMESDVAFFVTSTLSRRQMTTDAVDFSRRVLVITRDEKIGERIKRNLEKKEIEVLLADNLVDGFYRLRMSPPGALVVGQDLGDLPGIEVARIVKGNHDFRELPIYLFGGEDAALAARAKEIGIEEYFPPAPTIAPDIALALSKRILAP